MNPSPIDVAAPVIELDRVTFSYAGPTVIEDATLIIAPKEFVCIVGPNGGGKSTLIKIILGLLKPQTGSVRVLGRPPEGARQWLGYMPQQAQLDFAFPVNVMDVVLMGRLRAGWNWMRYSRIDVEIGEQSLTEVGMLDFRRRPFADLSGGQRQRVLLARALACRPKLLLLDEPTAGLDILIQEDLHRLLHRLAETLTVVMVSHDFGFVSHFATQVVCLKQRLHTHPAGKITPEMIAHVYGRQVQIIHHNQLITEIARS